jgi:hypothetical protein
MHTTKTNFAFLSYLFSFSLKQLRKCFSGYMFNAALPYPILMFLLLMKNTSALHCHSQVRGT